MKSPYINILAHTTWECKHHIVFAPKFRRKEIYRTIKVVREKNASEIVVSCQTGTLKCQQYQGRIEQYENLLLTGIIIE